MITERGEGTPTAVYGLVDDCWMVFWKVCPKCGRFVKADDAVKMPEYAGNEPNATCKKCGRVKMDFCTWVCDGEGE